MYLSSLKVILRAKLIMIFAARSNSRSDVVTQCVSSSVRPSAPSFLFHLVLVSPSPKSFNGVSRKF